MTEDNEAKRRSAELRGIKRELEQMSDWELERGLASVAFDDERRSIAERILRARYSGFEVGITLWILAISFGVGVMALLG